MKTFDKWLVKEVGIQDASIFTKDSLVREVALKWGKYKSKMEHCKLTGRPLTKNNKP